MNMKIAVTAAFVTLMAPPLAAQQANLEWVGFTEVVQPFCGFDDIVLQGTMVFDGADQFSTLSPGGAPAEILVDVSGVQQIDVVADTDIVGSDGLLVPVIDGDYTGSSTVGGTSIFVLAPDFFSGNFVDTPDNGADNFLLELNGNALVDGALLNPNDFYTLNHILTCVFSNLIL